MIAVAAARLANASLKPAPRAGAGPEPEQPLVRPGDEPLRWPRTTGGEQALDFASVVRIGHVSLLRATAPKPDGAAIETLRQDPEPRHVHAVQWVDPSCSYCACCSWARPAPATAFKIGVFDPEAGLPITGLETSTLQLARASGATTRAYQRLLADSSPAPGRRAPTDPLDPAYEWSSVDAAVTEARALGMSVLLSCPRAPPWAEEPGRPASRRARQLEAAAGGRRERSRWRSRGATRTYARSNSGTSRISRRISRLSGIAGRTAPTRRSPPSGTARCSTPPTVRSRRSIPRTV